MNHTTSTIVSQQTGNSNLLINESPLYVIPSLATAIGLESAIIIQQIYFLTQNPKNGKMFPDGFRYIWNTYDDLIKQYFPFLSNRTLRRRIQFMENAGWLVTKHQKGSAKKYYRVDAVKMQKFVKAFHKSQIDRTGQLDHSAQTKLTNEADCSLVNLTNATGQVDHCSLVKLDDSYTKTTTEITTDIFLASDDAEKIIVGEIELPDSSLMKVSGEILPPEKTLHQNLLELIRLNIGEMTPAQYGKEGKGAKLIREYMELNPDTTLQDVQDCLTWIMPNKKMMQLSLTSVASQLPTYMTVKRKHGKVSGTQFLSAKERSDERLLNMDTDELNEGTQEVYNALKAIITDKPIAEIEKLVPSTQFKSTKERSNERLLNMDGKKMVQGAREFYEQLKALDNE